MPIEARPLTDATNIADRLEAIDTKARRITLADAATIDLAVEILRELASDYSTLLEERRDLEHTIGRLRAKAAT